MKTPDTVPHSLALVLDASGNSGPLRQQKALLKSLTAGGVRCIYIRGLRATLRDPDTTNELHDAGVGTGSVTDGYRGLFTAISELSNLLLANDCQIMQTHGSRAALLAFGVRWLFRRKARWIAFFHGLTYESWRVRVLDRLAIVAMHSADQVVVVAEAQRSLFARKNDVQHVPNAVLDEVSVESRSVDRDGLVFIGRLSPEKNIYGLLKAMSQLQPEGRSRLRIYGDGPESSSLAGWIDEMNLREHVQFMGTSTDVRTILMSARAVVLPSLSEGMPNILLEAVAARCRVVATPVGDVPKIMTEHSGIGTLSSGTHERDIAAAISAELKGERESIEMGEAIEVLRAFSLENRVRLLSEIYLKTIRREHA